VSTCGHSWHDSHRSVHVPAINTRLAPRPFCDPWDGSDRVWARVVWGGSPLLLLLVAANRRASHQEDTWRYPKPMSDTHPGRWWRQQSAHPDHTGGRHNSRVSHGSIDCFACGLQAWGRVYRRRGRKFRPSSGRYGFGAPLGAIAEPGYLRTARRQHSRGWHPALHTGIEVTQFDMGSRICILRSLGHPPKPLMHWSTQLPPL
jgi:hypothetical protein